MSIAGLVLGLMAFVAVLRVLNAQRVAMEVIGTSQAALGVLTDPDLSDDEKEARVRRAALRLFGNFLRIAGIAVAALAASALLVWGGAAAGFYTLDSAIALAMGWPFILVSSAAVIIGWVALERRRKPAEPTAAGAREEMPYGPLDKALHNFAFASPERQRKLADLETSLYRRRLGAGAPTRPVFVTSLPRAGTTILLEALAKHPDFACATYRHMPFPLAPLLWCRFAGAFRKQGGKAERAHADGIMVGLDSPEAFEEVLWMAFWPEHYRANRIRTWGADERNAEFERFFRTYQAKIVATRPGASRYLSKNNANIARLPLLEALHPDAVILIPVREPGAQVHSLLRQHRHFSDLHAREPFARQYMESIGHFEFGGALRPIDFAGTALDPAEGDSAAFWLRYWIDAFEGVLATAGRRAILIDYQALCLSPERQLAGLGEAIGLNDPAPLAAQASAFRPPRPSPTLADVPAALAKRARDLHAELCRSAINREACR